MSKNLKQVRVQTKWKSGRRVVQTEGRAAKPCGRSVPLAFMEQHRSGHGWSSMRKKIKAIIIDLQVIFPYEIQRFMLIGKGECPQMND